MYRIDHLLRKKSKIHVKILRVKETIKAQKKTLSKNSCKKLFLDFLILNYDEYLEQLRREISDSEENERYAIMGGMI